MTNVIKGMIKRASAMAFVSVLAFAVLTSGLSALPAYASENANPGEKYDPTKKEVLSNGHTDVFYPLKHNGKFVMAVEKDGSTFLKPENTILRVAKSTYTKKSQFPSLATEYYHLDISGNQKGNPLFPGWDTGYAATLVGAKHADEATADISIHQVTGPMNGRILMWTTEGIGVHSKKVSFEENDLDDEPETEGSRFMLPGVIHQYSAGHVHANWGFTQPGVYKLKVSATITNKNTNKKIITEVAEYTFEVEDVYSGEVPSGGIPETLDLHRRADFINPDDDQESHDAAQKHKDTDKDDGGDMRIGNIRDSGPHPHYHSYEGYGGLDLKVVNKPKGARIEWRYVRADEGPDAYGTTLFAERLQLPAEPAMNKMKVYAHATEGETQIGKDTAEATIVVEDHGADGRPVVKTIAPYKRYNPGDTLRARTVLLDPHVATNGITGDPIDDPTNPVTSIVKDYVWLIKKEGETEFKRIPGAVGSKLNLKLDASMNGATIRSSLVLKNNELYRNAHFDDFCDYIIEMKGGSKHNNNNGNNPEESDSEDEDNSSAKKRPKKNRKKNRKNLAGSSNFLNGIFGGSSQNMSRLGSGNGSGIGVGNKLGNGSNSSNGTHQGLNNHTNSGLFGSQNNGGFQFTNDFFKKKSRKKLKRAKNKRSQQNNKRNNKASNGTQNGSTSGSFTRTENSSGGSLSKPHRNSNGTRNTKKAKNNKTKKNTQTVRTFTSENKSKNNKSNNKTDENKNKYDRSVEEDEMYEDKDGEADEDESDASSHKSTKLIAAAAGTASIGLCTITGACSVFARSRVKLM